MLQKTFPVGPLACNCSVIADEGTREAIVIDPGDNVSDILELLRQRNLKLIAVAVTHAHIDHIGGAAKLKQATGAPVLLNSRDQELYDALDVQAQWIGIRPPSRTAIDAELTEGQQIQMGGTSLQVIETPGHTQGSICLYVPEERKLFAGDTLMAGTIGRTDLPGGNTAQILHSLRSKLMALPDDVVVIPGHGAETTIGEEREFNAFITGRVVIS